ncbi:MAG: class I SAM-dependent methyltransferase [Gammaproteobacteria bacterium]|nr:MAG: class I SAM-dependent methyltransferase [Gammaproteobacteria bacterium]
MDWLDTVAGKRLIKQEQELAGRVLERVFGDQIVQIGSWGPPGLLLAASRTQFSVLIGEDQQSGVKVRVLPQRLPVRTDCVDAVVLPHTLEISADPHTVLREVHRILRPDGKLIILGFNPLSFWGLRHRLSPNGYPPGVQRQISRHRLSDWLRLLNLSIDSSHACYASAASGRAGSLIRRLQWFASAYLLVATKATIPMTIIRPRLRRRARLVQSFANPTTRNVA